MQPAPAIAEPVEEVEVEQVEQANDPNDPAGRRSFLVAGFAGAAGMGMIAAGWALARWPDAVLASLDRLSQSLGIAQGVLGTAKSPRSAGSSNGGDGTADTSDAGGTRP